MRRASGHGRAGVLTALLLLVAVSAAEGVEYRLRVASLHEDSFNSMLRMGETRDGAIGPGLDALEARLDRGDFPAAALLYDRHLEPAPEARALGWSAVPVRAEVRRGGSLGHVWDEVRWEGTPGQRSVWVVTPGSRIPQELRRVALRGTGPLRHLVPYTMPRRGRPLEVIALPLAFLRAHEASGGLWEGRVAPILDLRQGIAVVVGASEDPYAPDQAVIVVVHAAEPTTWKAVLAWRKRPEDREAPWLHGRRSE